MKCKVLARRLRNFALLAALFAVTSHPSAAAVLNVVAQQSTVTIEGVPVTMWGFAPDTGQSCTPATPPVWDIGPPIVVTPPDSVLTIRLRNCLDQDVSIVIPGQAMPDSGAGSPLPPATIVDPQGRVRVTSFVTPASAGGGTQTYRWSNLKMGTYLYESGTFPALQVQMGLYGALIVGGHPGAAGEVTLLYSEIDPLLHDPAPAAARPLNYKPQYFLINGSPFDPAAPALPAGNINETLLLRFLNAGLYPHVPTLLGDYWRVVAEDGNPYPYPREQYSVLLAPGKTMDVLWTPTAPGEYPVVDHSHNLTTAGVTGGGMLAKLSVGTGAGPIAMDDTYAAIEDTLLAVDGTTLAGVLANDTRGTTAILAGAPSAGTLACPADPTLGLCADGTFEYLPGPDFNGTDRFTYKANDGTLDSNVATVRIDVVPQNDPPVAVADLAATDQGIAIAIDVLANDADVDLDPLTVTNLPLQSSNGGTLTLNPDQTVAYKPATGFSGDDTFTYTANDGTVNSAPATVTVTVNAGPNIPPVAVEDNASTTRNTAVSINVISNDSDPDGTIAPGTVAIVTQPTRRGTVAIGGDGTVIYTPRLNFRGTDIFTYTVNDNAGDTSNVATVRVNVR